MTLTADPPIRTEKVAVLYEPAEQEGHDAPIPTEQDPFPDRKRWTQKECDAAEAAGVLVQGEYELLNGDIIRKMSQYLPHSRANKRVFFAMTLLFGADYVLLPVSVSVNEENSPEPDVSVTQFPDEHYAGQKTPLPSDMRLIIEVSDATLWRDRNTKMVLYAQAGVPEYWVLDINGRKLWIHRSPTQTGYTDIQEYDETATATPQAAPAGTVPIRVVDLLP